MGEKMTIRDIAKLSGVAPSTVSRVLDDSQKISAATKKRVMAVVEEYKYHPQTAARNLARNKTSAIGIVISQEDMSLYSSSFFTRRSTESAAFFLSTGTISSSPPAARRRCTRSTA